MSYRFIFYDTETTGLKAKRDRIIEIAAFDPVRDKTFVSLINPECPIPKEASAVHHITDGMVAEAATFDKVGREFVDFCDGEVVLVAHNNDGFDIHFLRESFSRSGIPLPNWCFLDTLKWARRYRADLPRHQLQLLREAYGIAANNAHRALDDVKVLHDIFVQMVGDLKIEQIMKLMPPSRF